LASVRSPHQREAAPSLYPSTRISCAPERLKAIVADFGAALPRLDERATIAFNRMEEWGADGRIVAGAPVHSPFVRRKQRLELELQGRS
jgi:hypothetical protein